MTLEYVMLSRPSRSQIASPSVGTGARVVSFGVGMGQGRVGFEFRARGGLKHSERDFTSVNTEWAF